MSTVGLQQGQADPNARADSTAISTHGAPKKSASNKEKADYSVARWTAQRDYYSGLYRGWARAILFLLGKQWLSWNRASLQWTPERNVPKWRQQPVTNLVFAVYRSALAKLTKQRPAFDCVPPSGDADDRAAAALGDSLLKFWWRLLKMPRLLHRGIGWLLTTGNCYYLVSWDPEAGPITPLTTSMSVRTGEQDELGEDVMEEQDVAADKDGDPILKDDGTPDTEATGHPTAQGEIDIRIISPMCVRFNPEAESVEEATEFFIGEIKPSVVAAAMFDMDEGTLLGAGADELMTVQDMISAATSGLAGAVAFSGGSDNSTAKGRRSLILRYYAKQCDDYPEGRHWITVDGVMAQAEEALPEGFWPPIVPLQDLPVPGQPIAMGLLGQIIPLNEQMNTLDGQRMEHNITMAKGGKWILHPDDKGLPIDSDPAQKLVSNGYASGHPPMQAELKALPAAVIEERNRVISDVMLVSAIDGSSLGQKPEGVTSGRGFLALQEASDSVLGPTLLNTETTLEEIGRRCLVIAHRYYRETRTVKIGGENGVWQFRAFKGSDLTDSMDVQVQVGSSFPWSKAAKQDTALSLIQSIPGIVVNPQTGEPDMQKLARIVNIGGLDAFQPEEDPDSDEIEREHAEFEDPTGALPQIGIWQDHPKHLAGHYTFMKRDRARFDRMPSDRQAAFIQHLTDTQQAIAEGLQQMMPPAQMPSADTNTGAPSAPPGPSDPSISPISIAHPQGPGSDLHLTASDYAAA